MITSQKENFHKSKKQFKVMMTNNNYSSSKKKTGPYLHHKRLITPKQLEKEDNGFSNEK